jgi:NADP-dependent 3-hydroxy acid dehydrogenase YdfG
MDLLKDKIAIVTGASSGIGRAIARTLAAQGSHVFIFGRDAERLQEAAVSIRKQGGRASIGTFDLRDCDRLAAFVGDVARETGRLDIMVNAAGIDYPGSIAEGELSQWRDMFDTNVIAMLVGSQAAIRAMRETNTAGHIVTISSYAGRGDGMERRRPRSIRFVRRCVRSSKMSPFEPSPSCQARYRRISAGTFPPNS